MFLSGKPWMLLHSTPDGEAKRKQSGKTQSDADPSHASRPAEAVEELAEHEAADQAAEKVAGEIETAGGTAVSHRGTADKAGGDGLGEEGADTDQRQPGQHGGQCRRQQERESQRGQGDRGPERRACVETCDGGSGERRG